MNTTTDDDEQPPNSILSHHIPAGWRFYVYGEDDAGDPLFSFWMETASGHVVCLYERNEGHGHWLSTTDDDEDYEYERPSEELEALLGEVAGTGGAVDGARVESLPDHESYFFRLVHGTIEQRGRAPNELLAYIGECAGTEVHLDAE
jgi:hypothetical protein